MAESFLQHGSEALNSADRHQIVVHVDAETLRYAGAGRCELEDGPSLPAFPRKRSDVPSLRMMNPYARVTS
jgi:hypothetical protein